MVSGIECNTIVATDLWSGSLCGVDTGINFGFLLLLSFGETGEDEKVTKQISIVQCKTGMFVAVVGDVYMDADDATVVV